VGCKNCNISEMVEDRTKVTMMEKGSRIRAYDSYQTQ